MYFGRRHFHQRHDGFIARLKNIEQLANARRGTVDQIVRQHHCKWFVADEITGAKNRVSQSQWFFLPNGNNFGHFRDASQHFDQFVMAPIREHLFELRRLVKMVFDSIFATTRNENNLFDACVNRFLHDVLNRRDVDDRQQLLWDRFGCRQKSGAKSCDGNDSFFKLHEIFVEPQPTRFAFRSSISWLDLQEIQSVVTGRAFNRPMPISSPHSSQTPYSPFSRRFNASLILKMSLHSRSRMRRTEFRLASREARSVGSGKFTSWSMFSTVLPASKRSSLIR